jgi:SSS family solute:Na+ symporter
VSEMNVIWTTVAVYMGAMLAISAYARKYVKTSADFLLAGRRLGLGLTVGTLAATHYGGGFHPGRS